MKKKKIIGTNIVTGEKLVFESSEEAARVLGLANGSNIRNACKIKNGKSSGYF
jgi:hypothetical protein